MTDLDDMKHRIRTELAISWITPSLQLLCIIISWRRVSQRASRLVTVILSTVFDFDIVFSATTRTFLTVVDQSNTCTEHASICLGREAI